MGDNKAGAGDTKKSVHDQTASVGQVSGLATEGFGSNASNYESNRPGYTEEAVVIIADAVASVRDLGQQNIRYNVLEVGAGTGKLTEQLTKALPTATKYLALEPSKNFLDTLGSKNLGVDVVVASADQIPLPDQSVQAIVCAQSFHWFSNEPNINSLHRVLVPGGLLLLIWNHKHFDEGWLQKVLEQRLEVMRKVGGSTKELFLTGEWKEDIEKSPLFHLNKMYDLPGVAMRGDLEKILSNVTTVSAYNTLTPEERAAYIGQLRDTIQNWPGLDLNNLEIPFSTDVYIYTAK